MIDRFLVLGHDAPRPPAEKIIFCDGTGGRIYREGVDLELSHWRPNSTPHVFRAGTSTEICFRFLDAPIPGNWTLAVNNHLDVDGILSVYVLVRSPQAMAHRPTIVEAAEMGDFWGWGEPPAQRLFQGLTRLMNDRERSGATTQAIYEEAFERIGSLIDGTDPECASIDESLEPLRRGVALVEQGLIERALCDERFAHYVLPSSVVGDAAERASYVPSFNEPISSSAILWPEGRAKWDAQRVCLVSVQSPDGWLHDLWSPGYLWADTENRWNIPGLAFGEGMQSYDLANDKLDAAVAWLKRAEPNAGRWTSGSGASAESRGIQAIFPVIVRFADDEFNAVPSGLSPTIVASVLRGAF